MPHRQIPKRRTNTQKNASVSTGYLRLETFCKNLKKSLERSLKHLLVDVELSECVEENKEDRAASQFQHKRGPTPTKTLSFSCLKPSFGPQSRSKDRSERVTCWLTLNCWPKEVVRSCVSVASRSSPCSRANKLCSATRIFLSLPAGCGFSCAKF